MYLFHTKPISPLKLFACQYFLDSDHRNPQNRWLIGTHAAPLPIVLWNLQLADSDMPPARICKCQDMGVPAVEIADLHLDAQEFDPWGPSVLLQLDLSALRPVDASLVLGFQIVCAGFRNCRFIGLIAPMAGLSKVRGCTKCWI